MVFALYSRGQTIAIRRHDKTVASSCIIDNLFPSLVVVIFNTRIYFVTNKRLSEGWSLYTNASHKWMYKHALKRYPFSQSVSHAFTKCQLFAPLVARRSIELHSGGITLDFQPGGQSSTEKKSKFAKKNPQSSQCKILSRLITKKITIFAMIIIIIIVVMIIAIVAIIITIVIIIMMQLVRPCIVTWTQWPESATPVLSAFSRHHYHRHRRHHRHCRHDCRYHHHYCQSNCCLILIGGCIKLPIFIFFKS